LITLALRTERQCAECQKIKTGGLDHYGAERFGRLVLATIRKSVGLKELTSFLIAHFDVCCFIVFTALCMYNKDE